MGRMMLWMLLWGPFVLAVAIGIVLHLSRRGSRVTQPGSLRLTSALAGGVPALIIGLAPAVTSFWMPGQGLPLEVRALLPLLLGIAGVALLTIPPPPRRALAAADLSPRGVAAFVRPVWPLTMVLLALTITAITVAAGLASSRDELGRFTQYSVSIGTSGTEIGTGIYGWHYSVPSVIAIAALIIAALTAWALIARPAWADDVERDSALRRLRSSLVGRAVLGALLIHLFVVLQSLASTASLRGSAPSSELGTVSVGTPFAAMSPLLGGLGQAALIAGLALWILLALSALPMRTRRHSALAAA
ncbi:hypothetical protein FVO59_12325 [Microbacterium esteraromaticum]|uniref:Uncharacterized protein n=1 Tax=Microbacterium esteraromaticum TaxID=57043 RepID=A0A7D8ACV3_9MICO|nr:hypothetical protein [Microbacterium esteraromaticum]QMU97901.1 hypothetical protein FVO59_12325 [Microbacterium esteraromaticum]